MLQEFLMRKMLERQLANVPKEQQEMIMQVITKNPDLFKKIAEEIQTKMKAGGDQMKVMQEVMAAHRDELRKLL